MSTFKYQPVKQYEEIDFRSHFTFSGDEKRIKNTFKTESTQTCFDCICTSFVKFFVFLFFLVTFPISGFFCLKIAHQYERIIIYRLGRLIPIKGPGVVLVLPCIDHWKKVDMRTKAFNVPPSKLCTSDGCIISIGAIVHFSIQDPRLMSLSVQNMNHSIRDASQGCMMNLLCKKTYNDIKTKRQGLSYDLQVDINQSAKEWGLAVSRVELSDITLIMAPQNKTPAFMPMYGAPPPPETGDAFTGSGVDNFGGIAQFATQLFAQVANAQSQQANDAEPPTSSTMDNLLRVLKTAVNEELVQEVDTLYQFNITGIQDGNFFADLRTGSGVVGLGVCSESPDVTFSLSMSTLQKIIAGSVTPYNAYIGGQLHMDGDTDKAMKLEKVVKDIKI
nr:stomatin-like protein 1 [Ciona intestinalis]|eukprot:XP_002119614.1 stomatin-like protein 1 [Ciona intestinalis]